MAFCKKTRSKIADFLKRVDSTISLYLPKVIKITEAIKQAVDSKFMIVLTDLTPFEWDNQVRMVLTKALDIAIIELKLVDDCNDKDGLEKIKCYINALRKLPPAAQEAMYFKLAAIMLRYSHGRIERDNFYDTLVQVEYSTQKS